MKEPFSPQEILKIAVNVEKNGRKLYEILEGRAKDEKTKNIWKYLKEQEETHIQTFEGMLDNIGSYIVYEFNPGEYEAYLRAIASEYIFTLELIDKKIKEPALSDTEAVDFAVRIEKDSILTYSALREYILTEKQAVLDKVIEEEKKHLADLILLKTQMQEGS